MAALLRQPQPPSPPWAYYDPTVKTNPVMDAYINRVGDLGGDLPERIACFYTMQGRIILKTKMMAAGVWNNVPLVAAGQIDEGLAIWQRAAADGRALIADLKALRGN